MLTLHQIFNLQHNFITIANRWADYTEFEF